jgi:branched-chain amino acid transport system permease protein
MAVFQYLVSIATVGVIFSLLCLGLNMRYGWSGDLDLAYYMFGALGAYTYGVVTLPPAHLPPPDGYILGLSAPFVVGIVAAMLVAGLGSLLLGAIALRNLRGDYFSIVTIVTTLIVYATISQYTPLFDGFSGIFGYSEPFNSVLGLDVETYPLFYLGVSAAFLVVVYLFCERLFKSPYGRTMRAIREDDKAAMAFGRDVYRMKLKNYVISGMIAALGGALLSIWLTSWSPQAWSPIETLLLYAAIFVGGTGNNRGVMIGAVFIFVFIQEITRFIPTVHLGATQLAASRTLLIGLLIIGVLWLRPQGLLPEPRAIDKDPSKPPPEQQPVPKSELAVE